MRLDLIRRALTKGKKLLIRNSLGLTLFNIYNREKEQFACPICNYAGAFLDIFPETGVRKHAACPKCGSLERHRLQYMVMNKITETNDLSKKSILHFAPEPFFEQLFRKKFGSYASADLYMKNVDYKADLLKLPFKDGSYDFVFASHILEHIKDDLKALSEIARVLKEGGIAIIAVPIVGYQTIEYPEPNPHEAGHVRAPGVDYYERCSQYFRKVEKFDSKCFPEKYQVHVYEKRSKWSSSMPLRTTMEGKRHVDIVSVCIK